MDKEKLKTELEKRLKVFREIRKVPANLMFLTDLAENIARYSVLLHLL